MSYEPAPLPESTLVQSRIRQMRETAEGLSPTQEAVYRGHVLAYLIELVDQDVWDEALEDALSWARRVKHRRSQP